MAHIHNVHDDDPYFVIDPETRTITCLSKTKPVLIQGDHNSEVFTFEIPKYIDGHDMSKSDRIEIHFSNIGSGGNLKNDVYEVSDFEIITDEEGEFILFTWLISNNATKFVGSLEFQIKFKCFDDVDPDMLSYLWNTDIYKSITVSKCLDNAPAVVEATSDILEQWKNSTLGDTEKALDGIIEIQNTLMFEGILDDVIQEQEEILEIQNGLMEDDVE